LVLEAINPTHTDSQQKQDQQQQEQQQEQQQQTTTPNINYATSKDYRAAHNST